MKKTLIAVALAVFATSAAHGADLYRKAPPAPVASWTGWYAGVNVGGGWGDTTASYAPNDPVTTLLFAGVFAPVSPDKFKSSGVLGGVQVGYNYQFDRNWVAGLETDFQGAGIKGSGTTFYAGGLEATTAAQDIKFFGTLRGRLGYLPTDKLMVYATGGLAYAQLNNAVTFSAINGGNIQVIVAGVLSVNCGPPFGAACFASASSSLTPGWTAGGGLEYALSQKWTVKGEYLFANFRQTQTPAAVSVSPGTVASTLTAKINTDLNIARLGLNYRF